MPPAHVLIVGVSTRAAAESAARAGFRVTSIDGFADLDQHPAVRALSMLRDFGSRFTAAAVAAVARDVAADAVAYLSPFENHPAAVARLARGRTLWGNPPETLRRVRDPLLVAEALRRRGFMVPTTFRPPAPSATARQALNPPSPGIHSAGFGEAGSLNPPSPGIHSAGFGEAGSLNPPSPDIHSAGFGEAGSLNDSNDPNDSRFLLKPLASGGGQRIRPWRPGLSVPRGNYVQRLVPGMPGSVVFVAARGRAVPLGVSRQLVGERAFGASGYRYCGSILAPPGESLGAGPTLVSSAVALAAAVADEFGLVGVNGVDFVVRDGEPVAVEVNPRWSASMELAERILAIPLFAAHADACVSGRLPSITAAAPSARALGRAVVFAKADSIVGDTRAWLDDPDVRDVPRRGEHIAAGHPVCTVLAAAATAAECHTALVARAADVYAALLPDAASTLSTAK